MADYATHWYDGEGLPTNDVGLAGDYFLNTSNADIYKKISNTWQRIGNIRGAQGERGLQGEKGEKGLKGDRGDAGLTGPVGPQGSIGLSGSIWYDGIGVPETSLGVINDFYLNIFNGDIYKKRANNYWERVSSFLPDLTYYLNKIDEMINDGYEKISEIDATFVANMENMAKTFNTTITDMKTEFNSNMESFINVFYENQAQQQNSFNTFMSNSNNSFTTFMTTSDEAFTSAMNEYDSTFSTSVDDFNNTVENINNTFEEIKVRHEEEFDNALTDYENTVNTYVEEKDAELEERFRALADVSAQNEILEARTAMDGTVHPYLKERLIYDFNNLNLDVDYDALTNQINNIDNTLKE